jgi:hypothetical protein
VAFVPHEQNVFGDPKNPRNTEKSPPASLDFREQKLFWLALLAYNGDFSQARAKAIPRFRKKGRNTAGLKRRNWRFVRFTSKTLCRLHLVVLVDLIMFTHIQHFCKSLSHVFRRTLSQIQYSTSRLAAACRITPCGTGTSRHRSEAPVTMLQCHMDSGTCSCCRCK